MVRRKNMIKVERNMKASWRLIFPHSPFFSLLLIHLIFSNSGQNNKIIPKFRVWQSEQPPVDIKLAQVSLVEQGLLQILTDNRQSLSAEKGRVTAHWYQLSCIKTSRNQFTLQFHSTVNIFCCWDLENLTEIEGRRGQSWVSRRQSRVSLVQVIVDRGGTQTDTIWAGPEKLAPENIDIQPACSNVELWAERREGGSVSCFWGNCWLLAVGGELCVISSHWSWIHQ